MNFNRVSAWHEISDCGAYTVAVTRSQDLFKFHAWLLGKPSELLGTFDDAESARKCCSKHRDPPEVSCSNCGRQILPHEGEKCPTCGGLPGEPPHIYANEEEWRKAQKAQGGGDVIP